MNKKLQKNIFILTLPIFIELAFFILMGSVDTIMISAYEKANSYATGSVAAVGNASTVINLFGVLLNVVSTGIAVVVSQYLGAKRVEESKKTILTGIFMQVFIGLAISLLLLVLGNTLFKLIGTPVEILDLTYKYLFYTAISLIFVAVSNAISASLRSHGHTTEVMVTVMVANLFNIFFNYIFIFGYFGVPEMGVSGAALSTMLMRLFTMLVSVVLLKKIIGLSVLNVKLHVDQAKKILKVGIPSALENMTYNVMQFVILSFVNKLGTEMITARTYVNTMLSYIYLFSGAFASGNAIITGYYIGEEDYEGAYKNTLKTTIYTLSIVTSAVLILNVFATPVAKFFTEDPIIIKTIRQVLWFALLLEVGRALNLVIIQSLRATGDTTFPLVMAVFSMLGIGITFAYLFSHTLGLGLLGIYLGIAVDELFRGFTMLARWIRRSWVNKSLVRG
ncbi:MAG: MATE family efflux transporter [Acholeplasma sp.]|nr:MATE family efflux transporter [Acholeplasma sp.]